MPILFWVSWGAAQGLASLPRAGVAGAVHLYSVEEAAVHLYSVVEEAVVHPYSAGGVHLHSAVEAAEVVLHIPCLTLRYAHSALLTLCAPNTLRT